MCLTVFWVHECVFCGTFKDNTNRYNPEVTDACPDFEEKLQWRFWVCPRCEEQKATDERKFLPGGQRRQQQGIQNGPQFQNAPQFQNVQQLQNGIGGHHNVQQYPPQQGGHEQPPPYFQMGNRPRHQNEPRPQGRHESHGHHHHY
ncbi:uncharacterized protein BKA55DRAFT_543913 [Fusarium redolens]|uniref:Uncharacterized protein n=1 Tax=Fusarium redolens TaxID=48865 RepID=A0A9P9G9L2_FUSRE|nr:uncharacterized protein BKA55DRAFT_543913 [Fusarium redolens]KAH7234728.1 hypothetical protein BKA55DRAFT_543913 [Fusarium redolens]